ncbi:MULTISPECIES: Gfo/Idh/MocA family oxidoreductase [unclassified Chelatococcus]|uniref:Gfo/Idh/MocA family protein n=1 Tax=unclassified Chelatococcus TaxID=2638111 RepID=UPI001BD16302|nr:MULTISPECIES: Gfo/Idh/MocA family oxidoreductase [unclassified Chelatococcus]CAH1649676.1 1,5-anhydro-D-fructose reductase (1,5-anhydro-D-mannitol-forming) [Hyphomicrobiales bacterium]MBS7743412.1 Gfo/Idh/MocA family oxidoreductase [Chelatococcus sp. HY11]MBX3541470.1 Gfo/Idh/MocA family oxidoreductase [Chelatococcus sp.]MCO5074636.1 Gfo/Idh/MocA family oxidoreductase [Chelatococcus sp.]CAH1692114.1 1,5-anhydro-D-fructose reductase (1,5-anhydro-D-mannitol-forming) [Hyphomicrobiales bacteriu
MILPKAGRRLGIMPQHREGVTMRWGLIGAGAHALQKIAPALRSSKGASLKGGLGSSPDKSARFAAEAGGIAYPSLEAMLGDDEVDAVFIATPNDQHREQTEKAAAAGKHVLVEKPMALTEGDCRAMIAACERAGVALGIGFQQRHAPVNRALRELIASGELGDIVLVRGEWHTAYGPWTNWRADPAKSGSDILGAVGVHVFDLLGFLVGADVAETASIVDRAADTGLDQTIAAALRYANGAMGTVTITRRARAALNSIHVLGTKGAATGIGTLGMAPTGRLEITREGHTETREFPVVDLYAAQFEAFAEAVAAGRSPSASGADGLKSVALTAQLLKA